MVHSEVPLILRLYEVGNKPLSLKHPETLNLELETASLEPQGLYRRCDSMQLAAIAAVVIAI